MRFRHIVTFKDIADGEARIFKRIIAPVTPPDDASGLYLPPSSRNQMMYTNQGLDIPADAVAPIDDGVLLFCRMESFATLLNVLLAHPPYTASVDVYHEGAYLAGYVYDTIDACLKNLTDVTRTHLANPTT